MIIERLTTYEKLTLNTPWNVLYFATAMSIVPLTGKAFWSRWWNGIGTKTSSGIFVAMRRLLILISIALGVTRFPLGGGFVLACNNVIVIWV